MNFLTNLFGRLFGKKEDQQQTQPVAPAQAPASSAPALTVQSAPSAPVPFQVDQTPHINPVQLVKAQSVAPPVPQNNIPVIGAAPSPEQPPEPSALKKIGNWLGSEASFAIQHPISAAKNVGSAIVNAPQVQGFANEISAPFVQNIYQKANEESQAKNDAMDAHILASARTQTDPVKKAHLLDLLKMRPENLDYNGIAGLNDTPLQVFGNAGGVALDALGLPSLVEGLIPGAVNAGAGSIGADSLFKATAKNVGVGALYGADTAAHDNVTDPLQFAEQTALGAGTGGAFSLFASGLGKLLSKFRGTPPEVPIVPRELPAGTPEGGTAGGPIATLTPVPDAPITTPQEDLLNVPTFQRNQEAAIAAQELKKAEVAGPRTVNDLKKVDISTQDMHSPYAVQEEPGAHIFTRPAGHDLNAAYVPFPETPGPRSMTDVAAPQKISVNRDISPVSSPDPVPETPVAPVAPEQPTVPPVAENTPVPSVAPAEAPVAQPPLTVPENAPLTAKLTEIPQETPLQVKNPVNNAAEVKAPRQAEILLNKESAADKAEMMKKLPKEDTLSLDTLQARGASRVAAIGDDAAVAASYAHEPAINGVEDYYAALEAAKRLSGLTDDASKVARANIYSSMLDFASKSGLNLRSTQILFHDMPVEMKVSVTLKNMVKSLERQFGADSPEVSALSDPARRSEVEAKLNEFFNKDQAIQDKMNVSRGILSEPEKYTSEQIDQAGQALNAAKEELSKNATEFAGFRDQIVPSNIGLQEKIGNVQRSSMLSSLAGGVRDLIQTPITAAREVINSKVEGVIGSALNKAKGTPGKYLDTGLSGTDLIKGVPSALKKAGENISKGDTYASIEDVLSNIKRTPDRTDLTGQTKGAFSRFTKAKTNLANDAVEGIKTGEITRQLRQEGQQNGLTGEALDKYVQAGSYDPPAAILRKGKEVQDVINNINGNPITDALRGINNAIGKIPGVGKIVANALDPFPTWLGGNIWNSITDRNVIANSSKFVAALAKGDGQQAVNQLAKTITGVGELYATGWVLSQTGVITDKDSNGDSYEGLYFHVGNRYIPVSMAGAYAPNLILGNIAYNSLNGEGSSVQAIADGLSNTVKSLNIGNVTGQNSWLTKSISQSTTDFTQALSTAAAGIAGQFIPALTGDANSVLNQTSLNPTHEAADTKVVNPDSASGEATDFPKTALAQLENKIPFLSQNLPRKDGVASQDFLDRVMQGNHEGDGQVQAKADEQAKVDASYKELKDNGAFSPKLRDILDSDTQKIYDKITGGKTVPQKELDKLVSGFTKGVTATGDTRFLEDGDYASNLAVLKMKRAQQAADKTTTEKELKQYDTQIKKGEVYQKYAIPYSLVEKYHKTDLSEWRNLGDPKSDTYDKELYQKLWDLDNALADAAASRNTDDEAKTFYSAKKKKTGSGSGSSASKGNKIGQIVDLGKVSLSKLAQGQSTGTPQLPTIPLIKSSELSKKRKITVS